MAPQAGPRFTSEALGMCSRARLISRRPLAGSDAGSRAGLGVARERTEQSLRCFVTSREEDILVGKPVSPDTRLKCLIVKSPASKRFVNR